MTARAVFEIVLDPPGEPLVIRDVGHDKGAPSITNDAEAVVEYLVEAGLLRDDRRLFYYDSDGMLDELVRDHCGGFQRFARPSNLHRALLAAGMLNEKLREAEAFNQRSREIDERWRREENR